MSLERPAAALVLGSPAARERLRQRFRSLVARGYGLERHLAGVLRDVLDHPGSLARAQLADAVLAELGMASERRAELAIGIESFHTASLLFDDLPAMDDARERRGRPCPHLVHGEAAAILAALALINQAYAMIWRVLGELPAERREHAAELVTECLGAAGILNGQAEDLHFRELAAGGVAAVERVALGKTVSLVRLALVLPAVVGGAGAAEVALLEDLARAWGLAYQGLDDCKDLLLASDEVGKSTARDELLGRPNLPAAAGWEGALALLRRHLAASASSLAQLAAQRAGWARLGALQAHLEGELGELEERATAADGVRRSA